MSTSFPSDAATSASAVFGRLDPASSKTVLTLESGQTISLPTSMLLSYLRNEPISPPAPTSPVDLLVMPVIEEQLNIQKREVATGTVRVQKVVEEREILVDEPLAVTTYAIERVPLNREITVPPEIRQEGETTIYPVVEEVVVVYKKLMLREEVRVTRQMIEAHNPQVVEVRVEDVIVERS